MMQSMPVMTHVALVSLVAVMIADFADSQSWGPVPVPGMTCSNANVASGKAPWADTTVSTSWTILYSTVLQRHWDRWLYPHDLIHNRCWPGQLNSTEPPMPRQCGYNTTSVWEVWPPQADPYATPLFGHCACPQLTQLGKDHAHALGQTLRQQYGSMLGGCRPGAVGLETEQQQKNEMSLQTAYDGLCGSLPDPSQSAYPKEQVIYFGGPPARGTPFFLQQGLCQSDGVLALLETAANTAKATSSYWKQAHELALAVAQHAGQDPPALESTDDMLDNIEDCIVVHACHGLGDIPAPFLQNSALFTEIDQQETRSRAWALNYYRAGGNGTAYRAYAARYYGYYFKVLLDRMAMAVAVPSSATRLNVQVLSDSNITPLLTMLGAAAQASRRPVWGSTLAFELWQGPSTSGFAVRVVYNGKTIRLGGACEGQYPLCAWSDWRKLLEAMIPSPTDCPEFYAAWRPSGS